jgi:hypothetical protein
MLNKSEWNLVAPCGLYCGECTAFLNEECGGCRSNIGLSRDYRKYCKIYRCLNDKGLKVCLECEVFPCKFFDFFKAEKLEDSSWFLNVLSNMKQLKQTSLPNFLRKKGNWLEERRKCAQKRGIKYCDECKQWPCELLKRPILVPADLKKFRNFMENIEK